MYGYIIYGLIAGGTIAAALVFSALFFRVVVSTNAVHIVQTASKTTSYGRSQPAGNTYYSWPAWIPFIGVRVTILPVSVFDQALSNYAAYDIDRVPIVIDIVGFFRISNPDVAAERVKDFPELLSQLNPILQGAARSILASSPIDEILGSRAVFGEKFTAEVTKDLQSWGVEPVKSIELMDIRDAEGSKAINNIMAKKKSFIEMESRVAVAENTRKAQTAELEAGQAVGVKQQEQLEAIGKREIEKQQNLGIANQQAQQVIADETAISAKKNMLVNEINNVRDAEIKRGVQVVTADQERQAAIIRAEGNKQQTILVAEGQLESARRAAEATQIQGLAKAEAEKALLLAPVAANITLAKEIGSNQGYQTYLIQVRTVEKDQAIGIAQAAALEKANVKIVATANDAASGLNLVSLGTKIGAAIDALKTGINE